MRCSPRGAAWYWSPIFFGSRIQIKPLIRVVRRHGLSVVKDCELAFAGREYSEHPKFDASLFSFGPIKTATAFGGTRGGRGRQNYWIACVLFSAPTRTRVQAAIKTVSGNMFCPDYYPHRRSIDGLRGAAFYWALITIDGSAAWAAILRPLRF